MVLINLTDNKEEEEVEPPIFCICWRHKEFILETDACKQWFFAILSQKEDNGKHDVIA